MRELPNVLKQPIFRLYPLTVKDYSHFNPDFSRTIMIFYIISLPIAVRHKYEKWYVYQAVYFTHSQYNLFHRLYKMWTHRVLLILNPA